MTPHKTLRPFDEHDRDRRRGCAGGEPIDDVLIDLPGDVRADVGIRNHDVCDVQGAVVAATGCARQGGRVISRLVRTIPIVAKSSIALGQGVYSSRLAAKLAGVSLRQLRYWVHKGLIVPGSFDAPSGGRDLFAYTDIVQARVIGQLRNQLPRPALFGAVLSIVGLVLLAAGALPHVATAPLSELYHAAGASPQDQTTLLLVWHGIHAMFHALLVTGLVILPMGLIAFGEAMLGAPDFGTPFGRTTMGLGVAGFAAGATLVVQDSAMAAVGVFALIGFHLILGRKTLKLATAPQFRMVAGA